MFENRTDMRASPVCDDGSMRSVFRTADDLLWTLIGGATVLIAFALTALFVVSVIQVIFFY
jgi:hypothetical protein